MPDRFRALPLLLCAALLAAGCGYRLSSGRPRGQLATVKSLAILPLENDTLGFRIEQSLTSAVHQAFVARFW